MSKDNSITKKQHYIPQVYLRGFSPEYERGKKSQSNSRYTVYVYDLNKKKQNLQAVPIKSICYSENLYEVTGRNGEIVLPNYLERVFACLEKKFSAYRGKLEKKAFIESNYKTNCFLTYDEKVFWVTYIIIQILRMPQILDVAEKLSEETWGKDVSLKQTKNIARMFCLPFFNSIEEDSIEMYIFNALFEPVRNMSFGVGVDRQKRIVTSNKTVYIGTRNFPCEEYDEIIFPITSELCLFLFGNENKQGCRNNFLFSITDEIRGNLIYSMASSSFEKLYSNHILDKNEKKYIKNTREFGVQEGE